MLWDRCIELGIEARKKLREFCHYYESTGQGAEERWFFDPFVPDIVTIRDSKFIQIEWSCLGGSPYRSHQT